jgi:hypothetical protein
MSMLFGSSTMLDDDLDIDALGRSDGQSSGEESWDEALNLWQCVDE